MSTNANTLIFVDRKMPLVVDMSNISTTPNRNQNSTEATLGDWERLPLPPEVERDLERIAALHANWDGDGIAAVDPITIERSKYVLRMVFMFGGGHLTVPLLGPAHDGRMILEWGTSHGKELIVDVPASRLAPIRFLLVEPTSSGSEIEIESEISDEWSIQAIIHRLVGSQPTVGTSEQDVTVDSNLKSDY